MTFSAIMGTTDTCNDLLFVMLVVATLGGLPAQVRSDCTKITSCSCEDTGGAGVIDLTPLDGGSGTPQYKDFLPQTGSQDYKYSWNPCSSFSETAGCQSVSGCQVMSDGTNGYPIGTQESAKFTTDASSGNVYINYEATDSTQGKRYLTVQLVCDENAVPGTLQVVGETQQSSYAMALTSVHCCPQKGPGPLPKTSGGGLSVGSILTIVFFALLGVYALAGVGIQKFARKASGKEIIPNISFWASLPGLIKDGFFFTFTCGKRGGYNKM